MRVMVIVKASKESEASALPGSELLSKMGKYNEELAKAGLLLAADALLPSSHSKRVNFSETGARFTRWKTSVSISRPKLPPAGTPPLRAVGWKK